jgi:hypothetical protein
VNPYPTAFELRVEAQADRFIREHAEAIAEWRKALAEFKGVWDRLYFPLGSPVKDYDLKHIDAILADLSIGADDDEELAMDLARAGEPV